MLLGIPYHNWLEAFAVIFTVIAVLFGLASFVVALVEFRHLRSGRR